MANCLHPLSLPLVARKSVSRPLSAPGRHRQRPKRSCQGTAPRTPICLIASSERPLSRMKTPWSRPGATERRFPRHKSMNGMLTIPNPHFHQKRSPKIAMQTIVTVMSCALMLAIAALCREVRLRRALQDLLRRLFTYWRSNETRSHDSDARDSDPHRVHGRGR